MTILEQIWKCCFCELNLWKKNSTTLFADSSSYHFVIQTVKILITLNLSKVPNEEIILWTTKSLTFSVLLISITNGPIVLNGFDNLKELITNRVMFIHINGLWERKKNLRSICFDGKYFLHFLSFDLMKNKKSTESMFWSTKNTYFKRQKLFLPF